MDLEHKNGMNERERSRGDDRGKRQGRNQHGQASYKNTQNNTTHLAREKESTVHERASQVLERLFHIRPGWDLLLVRDVLDLFFLHVLDERRALVGVLLGRHVAARTRRRMTNNWAVTGDGALLCQPMSELRQSDLNVFPFFSIESNSSPSIKHSLSNTLKLTENTFYLLQVTCSLKLLCSVPIAFSCILVLQVHSISLVIFTHFQLGWFLIVHLILSYNREHQICFYLPFFFTGRLQFSLDSLNLSHCQWSRGIH